jgi:hypothetical protein
LQTNVSQTILVAGMGSFVLGYDINSMAGTIVQASFVSRFLSGSNANSIIGGIIGGYVLESPR